jgi:hypothetical protein
MVEKVLLKNALNAKWVIGSFVVGTLFVQGTLIKTQLMDGDVFGIDGNGGKMLKIITNLTDEEIARLKYVRRLHWHWKGSRKLTNHNEGISQEELADRGIEWPKETYIEYEKRPPHDKFL